MPDLNQFLTNLDVLLDYAIALGDADEVMRIKNRMAELVRLIN